MENLECTALNYERGAADKTSFCESNKGGAIFIRAV